MAFLKNNVWRARINGPSGSHINLGPRRSESIAVVAEKLALYFYHRYGKLPDYNVIPEKQRLCDWTPLEGVQGIYYQVLSDHTIVFGFRIGVRINRRVISDYGYLTIEDALKARARIRNAENNQQSAS